MSNVLVRNENDDIGNEIAENDRPLNSKKECREE